MIWVVSIVSAASILIGLLMIVFGSMLSGIFGLMLWMLAVLVGIYWELRKMGRGLSPPDDTPPP